MESAVKGHEDIWGRNQKQGDGIVEPKSPGQSGEEVLEPSSTDESVLSESENPDMGILQSKLESFHCSLLITTIDIGLGSIHSQSSCRNRSHVGAESLPVLREIGEEEADDDAGGYCEGTLEDVQPSPGRNASSAIQALEDTGSDEITESTCNEGSVVEDGHSEGKFFLGVPLGEVEDDLYQCQLVFEMLQPELDSSGTHACKERSL